MQIGLIDADLLDRSTNFPNLALMKLSAYFKEQQHAVKLLATYDQAVAFDQIYISKVFDYTKIPQEILNNPKVKTGGTGFYFDKAPDLPYVIEHTFPDYSLYADIIKDYAPSKKKEYEAFSIGFTTRGCFRKCPFCVNQRYNKVERHSPIEEFYDSTRPYISLLDDNFFGSDDWESILTGLRALHRPIQFKQGLDIRLMTEQQAEMLSQTKYYGDYIFAFDNIADTVVIRQKLSLWRTYCHKSTKLYLLCGFYSQDAKDIENLLERIKILMEYRCLPYVMRHKNYLTSKWRTLYVNLARWCNQPQFFKKTSFREYCYANQEMKKDKSSQCSCLKALTDFETEYPEIAKKYFDMKF